MGSIVPCRGNEGEFSEGGSNHYTCGHGAAQCNSGPSHWRGGELLELGGVNFWRVVGGVEPVHCYMQDPDPIKIDEEMCRRALFVVGLEKDFAPVNFPKVGISLSGSNVNQAFLWSRSAQCFFDKGVNVRHWRG